MAASLTALGGLYGNRVITDTSVSTAIQYNASGGAYSVFTVDIDNSANSAASYLKFWNVTSGATLGTTDPVMILMAPAGTKAPYGFGKGIVFSTAVSYACVTTAGTAGTSGPSTAVSIVITAG